VNADSEPITELPVQSLTFDFEGVFLNQYSRIVGVIGRIVNDSGRAEDLAVEVFWKLLRKPRRKTTDPGGWLYRTAIRTGLDELRKESRRTKYERMFSLTRVSPTPEQTYSENEKQQRVRKVLASINSRSAELLILRSNGLSYQEIAQALELNPASIGPLLSRAQQAFRKEYIKRYGER
jgi:RNA polymerase sigma-70 factor (ECF subfamily)